MKEDRTGHDNPCMDYHQDAGHLSQEVILAHHVPIPDLQRDHGLVAQLFQLQIQLQVFSPMWKTSLLDNLEKSRHVKSIHKDLHAPQTDNIHMNIY